MAATTPQLGLVTPTQGDLTGTWGNTVNNGITEYTDIAIAGTLTLTGDGAVTLANTLGDDSASNITSSLAGAGTVTAQFAIVKVSGTTTTKEVTGPSYSKTYVVDNASSFAVTFKASGQAGVSVAAAEKCTVYYNGTDYVKVASSVVDGVSTFSAGTTGLTPSTATSGAVTLSGTLAVANGGTNLTSFTANGVVYASSSSALTTGSALTFDGTNLSVNSPSTATTFTLADNAGRTAVFRNSLGTGGPAEIGTTTNHDFYVRAGASAGGLNILYLQAGGVTGYSLSYAGVSAWSVGGSEQMRLTSTGLGIGTSSPGVKLDVVGGIRALTASTSANTLRVGNTGNSTFLGVESSTGGVNIVGSTAYATTLTSNGPIQLSTNNGASVQATLDSTGLGIGTSSPARPLDVRGALGMQVNEDGAGTKVLSLRSDFAGVGPAINVTTNDPLLLMTNSTERARITSGGDLLVGGTSQSGTANRAAVFSANKFGLSVIDTTAQTTGVGGALNLGGNYRSAGDAQAFCRVAAAKENSTDANYAYAMTFATTPDGGGFTERARITAAGDVGIGTTLPTSKLTVVGEISVQDNFALRLGSNQAGGATILYNGNGNLDITPRNTFSTVFTAGNVGIGTNLPTAKLQSEVSGSTAQLKLTQTSYASYNFKVTTGSALTIDKDGTLFSTFDSSGNLGLGVTPSAQGSAYRTINISPSVSSYFSIAAQGFAACEGDLLWNARTTGSETFAYMNTGDQASRFRQSSQFSWHVAPSGTAGNAITFTQAMTLSAGGLLSVGTTNASGATIRGQGATNANAYYYLDANVPFGGGTSGQYSSVLGFALYTDSGARYNSQAEIRCISDGSYSGSLSFWTQNPGTYPNSITERGRFTAGGYFKASNTGSYIDAATFHEFTQTANSEALQVRATDASYGNSVFQVRASRNTTNNSFYYLSLYNDGASAYRMRVADSGSIGTAGSIALGTTTPPTSGIGVQFPATQNASSDANTLDDYEEGTWTPIDSSGAGLTFSSTSAKYVKIGRQVTAWAQVTYPSTANASNAAIGGLPFTIGPNQCDRAGGMIGYKTDSALATILGDDNNTFVKPRDSTGGEVTNASLSADTIYWAITYGL